jgi:hypothetical protein
MTGKLRDRLVQSPQNEEHAPEVESDDPELRLCVSRFPILRQRALHVVLSLEQLSQIVSRIGVQRVDGNRLEVRLLR